MGVEIWPQLDLHNQLNQQFSSLRQQYLEVRHKRKLKAIKKVQDVGQDDDLKERHVSINMKFKLVDLNLKKKAANRDDMKYTQIIITRSSPDLPYFNIRLVRNLSQCLHVDFSEKKKKQEDNGGDGSEDDDEDRGFAMSVLMGGGGGSSNGG